MGMWTPLYIAAFVLGILIVLISILSFLSTKRVIVLLFRLCFDVLSIIQLSLIYYDQGSDSVLIGIFITITELLREIIFIFKNKFKWTKSPIVPIFFVVISWLSLIWTYDTWISIIPVIGMSINTGALFMSNVKKTKITILFGQIFFISYYALLIASTNLLTMLNMLSSIAFFVSAFIGLMVMLNKEKHTQQEEPIKEEE